MPPPTPDSDAGLPPSDALRGNSPEDLLALALDSSQDRPSMHVPDDWVPPDAGHLSELLPEYPVECLIGRGGMGAVYKARQRKLNRVVAIKVLPAELARNAEFVGRFHREAQLLASLNHPGIVIIFDFGQTSEGHLYFVMEHVEGTDLHHLIHGSKVSARQALDLTVQICEAMQYAHEKGVVHRDIKPANVLVTTDGRAKLADFGLALKPTEHAIDAPGRPRPTVFNPNDPTGLAALRFTKPGTAMGTADYAAPEVYEGKADARSDIYALGIMLYEMLTGAPPKGYFALPSTKARVDPRVDGVVIKALEIDPMARFQKASEMRLAVEQATVPLPVEVPVEEVTLEIVRPGTVPPPRHSAGGSRPRPAISRGAFFELAIIAVLFTGAAGAWYGKRNWLEWMQHFASGAIRHGVAAASPVPEQALVGDGFVALLDRDHQDGWQQCGPGGMAMNDGVATLWREQGQKEVTYFCYTKRSFKDFTLKLEFRISSPAGNSGVALRFPFPGSVTRVPGNNSDHYHVDISDTKGGMEATGAIMFVQPPSAVPMKEGQWNTLEITAMGQRYLVTVNGLLVNDFTGNRSTSGFLGLQNYRPEGVQFRNIRIKETTDSRPAPGVDALRNALLAEDWSFHNRAGEGGTSDWDMTFRNDGTARIHNVASYITTWRWWLTSALTIHVQTAADSSAYDAGAGFDLRFNDDLVSFSLESSDRQRRAYGERHKPAVDTEGAIPAVVKIMPGTRVPVALDRQAVAGGRVLMMLPDNVQLKFCYCPPGTFNMGSPASELGRQSDEGLHQVHLDHGFWMAQTTCTQGQWTELMGTSIRTQASLGHSSQQLFGEGRDFPMYFVNHDEAVHFCEKLDSLLSLPQAWKVALPTESQWEYACRAGTWTVFSFGNELNGVQANCNGGLPYRSVVNGPYLGRTSAVGSYPANAWGLYDMHGNVWQWCAEGYGDKLPNGTMSQYSFRGGSWDNTAFCCRSAGRSGGAVGYRARDVGFRPVLVPVY